MATLLTKKSLLKLSKKELLKKYKKYNISSCKTKNEMISKILKEKKPESKQSRSTETKRKEIKQETKRKEMKRKIKKKETRKEIREKINNFDEHERNTYLLYGYIRYNMQNSINYKLIPLEIVKLCINFYYLNFKIFLIKGLTIYMVNYIQKNIINLQ